MRWAAAALPPGGRCLGVGIDLAERSTFARLPEAWVRQAAGRWLTAGERRWCAAQGSFREAVVVVLCCKEAAYKAWNGTAGPWTVSLGLRSATGVGGSAAATSGDIRIEIDWKVSPDLIVALARAATSGD